MMKSVLAKLADKKAPSGDTGKPSRLKSATSAAWKAVKADNQEGFEKALGAAVRIAIAESK